MFVGFQDNGFVGLLYGVFIVGWVVGGKLFYWLGYYFNVFFCFIYVVLGIEVGDFVGFGQGGIVECVFDEIFDGVFQVQYSLVDVDEFGCVFIYDVGVEKVVGFQ